MQSIPRYDALIAKLWPPATLSPIVLVFLDKAGILIGNLWDFDYVALTWYELTGLECVNTCAARTTVANEDNFAGLQQGAAQPGNNLAGSGESPGPDGPVNGKYGRRADITGHTSKELTIYRGKPLHTQGLISFLAFLQKRILAWATTQ